MLRLTDPMNSWDKNSLKMAVHYSRDKIKLFAYIREIKNRIKWSRQRMTRGYADTDCWNVDDYLQILIPNMLEKHRENHLGVPLIDGKPLSTEEWEQILDRMVFLWREADENTCTRKNPYEEEYFKALKEFEANMGCLEEGWKRKPSEKKIMVSDIHCIL